MISDLMEKYIDLAETLTIRCIEVEERESLLYPSEVLDIVAAHFPLLVRDARDEMEERLADND